MDYRSTPGVRVNARSTSAGSGRCTPAQIDGYFVGSFTLHGPVRDRTCILHRYDNLSDRVDWVGQNRKRSKPVRGRRAAWPDSLRRLAQGACSGAGIRIRGRRMNGASRTKDMQVVPRRNARQFARRHGVASCGISESRKGGNIVKFLLRAPQSH
ncbi:hypothetical protein OH77DRAFT_1417673 [Trametes cingulata]|nr:hypothetical protein OH77DRAFT_1417673 [Trametes cingulata]